MEINQILDEDNNIFNLKRTPVIFTVILSIITLGVYLPYWFLTRRKILNKFNADERISFITPMCFFILTTFIALTIIPVNLLFDGWI
ncbi:hypothetical protein GCM10007063_34720 [Lentibacillus kapialis]|uniref:DUF4234 domain-containing protein n=1 Tax=Lentibacillus kapialis TaxID=340214 RepID=A0A917V110_9BACI|nr:DUF4234 domain-containing protein [Lentibacillus kapialis]GGK09329.1 hypothetical protein GCM10007063_34720 [Lentibacillus kapialis]